MGFVILMMVGRIGPAVDASQPEFDADDLIRLADPASSEASIGPIGSSPALIEAPRLPTPADDEPTDSSEAGEEQLAGPSASLDSDASDTPNALDGSDPTGASGRQGVLVATGGAQRSSGENGALSETGTPTERGEAALATISYPWQQILPEWTIDFLPEKDGLYGLTLVPDKRIEVYVRNSQTKELLAHVIAHELGHAVDVTLNDGPDRRTWAEVRGTGDNPWWPGNGTTDFSTGAGDFAESFAAWQVGGESFRSTLAGPPTQSQIELLAQLAAG